MKINTELVDGSPFVRVWFQTTGCTYDRQGLCTMCNYGVGKTVSETVVSDIRAALQAIPLDAASTILVSPSGSMFDPREVPDDVRVAILKAVAETNAGTVVCESRPETITNERMQQFSEIIGPKQGVIELGLESANAWILQWCVNKRLDLDEFHRAVDTCHRHDLKVIANVSLGAAFLPPRAELEDAERTVLWAMESGADACVVFPIHVRDWTVLGWLWKHGNYQPSSLWSLIEILQRVGSTFPKKVSTAWYRDYNVDSAVAGTSMPILASPTTCPCCIDQVLEALDDYRATGDSASLAPAVALGCHCREEWLDQLGDAELDLVEMRRTYSELGTGVMGRRWWQEHGTQVLDDLTRTQPRFVKVTHP